MGWLGLKLEYRNVPELLENCNICDFTAQRSLGCISALLDSGAEGIIIDQDFATRNKLTLRTLVNPLPVKKVDGTLNKRGSVRFTTIQHIHIKTLDDHYHEELSELYVTTLGDHDIIFGTDWLHTNVLSPA